MTEVLQLASKMYTVKGITWRADIGGLTQSQNTKYMIGNMKIES